MVTERSGNIRRTGIFGGTFNPVHYGHLINIEFIREKYSLDRIILVPAKIPVHKEISDRIEPYQRFEMTTLAVRENPYFEVSPLEIEREAPSYTIITVNELAAEFPDDKLYLIIGSDSFNELDTWKSYKELLALIPLIVMKRPGSDALRTDILEISKEVNVFENPLIDISSSQIRDRIKKGLTVRYLLPDDVAEYIYNKELYRN